LEPLLGKSYAPVLFAIALIAAGQSSTVTGTLAGQIVMEGYLHLRIAPWLRRLITRLLAVIPAILVITFLGESATGDMLIFSQVLLSMQLGFAVVPLLHYVSNRRKMGEFAIGPWVKTGGWVSASIIVALNINLVYTQVSGWLDTAGEYRWLVQFLVVPFLLFVLGMLFFIVAKPLIGRAKEANTRVPHIGFESLTIVDMPDYQKVAVALDFSAADRKALQHALHIGGRKAEYLLIHIVETAGARAYGPDIQDMETQSDIQTLEQYVSNLTELGFIAQPIIGYGIAKKAIPTVVNEYKANLLVMGAHGHSGINDMIFGTTVGAVRHAVKIPVLIVR
jgi:manganese transport protein